MSGRTEPGGSIRPMVEADLPMVRHWRNHPDIRAFMLDPDPVTEEQHRTWFAKANQDPGRVLLIFESCGSAVGFAQFSESRAGSGVVDWGFYAAPEAPKGTGRRLCLAALRYAFESRMYRKVCGQVLDFNVRSVRLHERLGFRHEGRLREQHRSNDRYCDLVCFGYLSSEWKIRQGS